VAVGSPRRDVALLFATRALRLFGFGLLSVTLALHLGAAGLSEARIGLLFSLTLAGDTAISLLLTTRADRAGRRRTLRVGAALMVLAGAVFAASDSFLLLLLAATLGVVSPAGGEVGPFLAVEQAALTEALPDAERTRVFAWYTLAGSLATATGALAGGALASGLQGAGLAPLAAYRWLAVGYGGVGAALFLAFGRVSASVEVGGGLRPAFLAPGLGIARSRGVVARLAGLFAVDAFAGGFIVQSLLAWWLHRRFGADEALLGALFFGANALAGFSALAASALARRFGLVNTMVFTHLPSNVLLLLVPLAPTFGWAVGLLLLRFSISQMDVPTRQSYLMAVVDPAERSAAAGVAGVARTVGAALAPVLAGPLYASAALSGVPFFLCGGLKIAYDLALWRGFSALRPAEERRG
jgi:MFS family permease